jgi:O-antigen/teichoic acid export membrane protein
MALTERKKTFIYSIFSNYGANILSAVIGIISLPLALRYFGIARYGVWAVISSVIAYLNITKLGIPTAVSTLVSKATKSFIQWLVLKRAVVFLAIISSSMLCVLLTINYLYPNWVNIIGDIPPDMFSETAGAVLVAAVLLLVDSPITLFGAGFVGLQKMYWERFYTAILIIAGFLSLVLTVVIKGNLITLALFRGLAQIFIDIICATHFLIVHSKTRKKADESEYTIGDEFSSKSIFNSSIRFFIIGIAAVVVWSTDNLVISHFLGVEHVTPYAVTFRIFGMLFAVFIAVNGALFPMFGKAAGLKQWDWIKEIYTKAIYLLPIIGGLIWLGGVAFTKNIIDVWAGPDAYGGVLVVFALGGYGYLLTIVNMHAYLLTGLNATKNLLLIGWAEAIANIGISILLVRYLGIGGVALGTFLASLFTCFWLLILDVYKQTEQKLRFNTGNFLFHTFIILAPFMASVFIVDAVFQNELIKIACKSVIVILYIRMSWKRIPDLLKKGIRDIIPMNKLTEYLPQWLFSRKSMKNV